MKTKLIHSLEAGPLLSPGNPGSDPLRWRLVRSRDYYGADAQEGKTRGTAWKTLERVNAHGFEPGDRILFKGPVRRCRTIT